MIKYRYDLGVPPRVCMTCASELKSDQEKEYGLCEHHQMHILKPPREVFRQFGRGSEYQLLQHSDELDDIIYQLEYPEEDGGGAFVDVCAPQENPRSECLIFAHYIARIFLESLQAQLSVSAFDYVFFPESGHVSMEIIFTEMGYLSEDKAKARLFLQNQLQEQLQEQKKIKGIHGKRVLLLDLYRDTTTRMCIDQLRLSGAAEVVTVYLTSYS